jgi:hypothetical protein
MFFMNAEREPQKTNDEFADERSAMTNQPRFGPQEME